MFFLPYRIERVAKGFPWLTAGIIALNVLVFLASFPVLRQVVDVFAFRLSAAGFLYGWFTSMFLHGGLSHIFFNMYFLWLFGSYTELVLGWKRWLATYVAAGFASALMHGLMTLVLTPAEAGIPLIGASGALAGIMGLFMVRFYKTKMRIAYLIFLRPGVWRTSSLTGIGLYLAGEVFSGVMSAMGGSDGTAHWAHVGGLALGIAVGLVTGGHTAATTEEAVEDALMFANSGSFELATMKLNQIDGQVSRDPELLFTRARASLADVGGDTLAAAADVAEAVRLFTTQNRAERAVEAYGELIPLLTGRPLDPRTYSNIGSAAESLWRFDVATHAYGQLIENHPASPEVERALFRLAHVYQKAGSLEYATHTWKQFKRAFPHSDWLAFADPGLESAIA